VFELNELLDALEEAEEARADKARGK